MKLHKNPHKKGTREHAAYQQGQVDLSENVLHVAHTIAKAMNRVLSRKRSR